MWSGSFGRICNPVRAFPKVHEVNGSNGNNFLSNLNAFDFQYQLFPFLRHNPTCSEIIIHLGNEWKYVVWKRLLH